MVDTLIHLHACRGIDRHVLSTEEPSATAILHIDVVAPRTTQFICCLNAHRCCRVVQHLHVGNVAFRSSRVYDVRPCWGKNGFLIVEYNTCTVWYLRTIGFVGLHVHLEHHLTDARRAVVVHGQDALHQVVCRLHRHRVERGKCPFGNTRLLAVLSLHLC